MGARAHVLALQYLLDGGQSIAVNLASGQGASVREVIDTASAVTGIAIDARDSPR
jgi:UDP-glucose 4-epimerase